MGTLSIQIMPSITSFTKRCEMKKPYDFLSSDKEPFVFVTKSKISVKNGALFVKNKEDELTLCPANINILFMGYGTNITNEASILCAQNDCYICNFKGGFNVHSIWHCGRYQQPEKLVRQVELFTTKKLEIAKFLMGIRFHKNHSLLDRVMSCDNVNKLLALEAVEYKKLYKKYADRNNIKFKRDKTKNSDELNTNMTILCNMLYNITTVVAIQFGFSPSLGFIHGETRRGGLCFDLADLYKDELVLKRCFESKLGIKEAMYGLSSDLKRSGCKIIKNMFKLLNNIYEGNFDVCDNIKLIKKDL